MSRSPGLENLSAHPSPALSPPAIFNLTPRPVTTGSPTVVPPPPIPSLSPIATLFIFLPSHSTSKYPHAA